MKGRARADHASYHLRMLTQMIEIEVELPKNNNNFQADTITALFLSVLAHVKELALADVQVTLSQIYHHRM